MNIWPRGKSFPRRVLHEATTSPFPLDQPQKALHAMGVNTNVSYIAWAYNHEVPHAFEWGHPADVAPPLPWPNRRPR